MTRHPNFLLVGVFLLFLLSGLGLLYTFDQNIRYQFRLLITTDDDILSYIPAETSFFSGGTRPKPFKHVLDLYVPEFTWLKHINWQKLKEEYTAGENPAANMIFGLVTEYFLTLAREDFSPRDLGLADPFRSATYTIELLPVYRIRLEHPESFLAHIKAAENTAKVKPKVSQSGVYQLRRYSLHNIETPDEDGHARFQRPGNIKTSAVSTKPHTPKAQSLQSKFELVIAYSNNYAVITLAPRDDEQLRERLLGLDKPGKSLANSGLAEQIQQEHGFWPAMFGFINVKSLIGHTLDANNPVSAKLDEFFSLLLQLSEDLEQYRKSALPESATEPTLVLAGESPGAQAADDPVEGDDDENILFEQEFLGNEQIKRFIAGVRHPACQVYLKEAAENWPLLAFGYTRFDLNHSPNHEHKVVYRNTDREFLQAAVNTRGLFPDIMAVLSRQPLFSLSMGVNMNQLAPYYTTIMKKEARHSHCVLSYMQQGAWGVGANLMIANVMNHMLRGLQGVAFHLLDVKWQDKTFKELELIVTISADDPQGLLVMFSPLTRWLPLMDIPTDGTSVAIAADLELPFEQEIYATIKGKHILFYTGDLAARAVNRLTGGTEKTGMLQLDMDFSRLTLSTLDSIYKDATTTKKDVLYNREVREGIENSHIRSSYNIDANLKAYIYTSHSKQ